jgi:hypothetical protein
LVLSAVMLKLPIEMEGLFFAFEPIIAV